MLELFIDRRRVEIAPDSSLVLSASVDALTEPGSIAEKIHRFRIPMTPANRRALGFPEQTLAAGKFNTGEHPAEIRCRDAVLLQGTARLDRCETAGGGGGWYEVSILVPPPAWIRTAARKKLSETPVAFDGGVNEAAIRESWTADGPVKFLPVKRDRYPRAGDFISLLDSLNWEDYHPFVQIKALVEAIAGQEGYRVESQFLNEPFFPSLYMSGNYPAGDNAEAALFMDFLAVRNTADRKTTFNAQGKIITSNKQTANSVGAPVDTSTAYTGSARDREAAYFGTSFRMIDSRPAFVPEQTVVAGFEFRLKYTAEDVSIRWEGETLHSPADHSSLDRKNTGGGPGYYWIVNPAFGSGNHTVTVYLAVGSTMRLGPNSAKYRIQIIRDFVRAVYTVGNSEIEDWTLYTEADYLALDLTPKTRTMVYRSLPRLREKGVPVYFDTLTFEGGISGAAFTLHAGGSVRPVFYSAPGVDSAPGFAGIFNHDQTQLTFIEALAHLFGLYFHTDERTKTLYIEPRLTYLDRTQTIDWTAKIDPDRPILLEETGGERPMIHSYHAGDTSVERWEKSSGERYAAWALGGENPAEAEEIPNPLFRPTFDERGGVVGAPDASLVVVGSRNTPEGTLDFPPKIVRWIGMKTLPDGQTWGWPAPGAAYPLAMFHSAGEDWYTLCFDDWGGQLGLKNYHTEGLDALRRGKKLTLPLRLTPSDMEAILYPNSVGRDFRGHFMFRIRGEKLSGRLLTVEGYDPAAGGVARCTFLIEL